MGLNILAWAKAKKYTDNAVSQTSGLHREIVNSLPATGDEHVIYMVPKTGSGNDNYDEYMWINGSYEFIGSTAVDLTDYYNKTQVDTALNAKQNKIQFYSETMNISRIAAGAVYEGYFDLEELSGKFLAIRVLSAHTTATDLDVIGTHMDLAHDYLYVTIRNSTGALQENVKVDLEIIYASFR